MNLFFLSENPVLCAQQHCNKHVVKMVTETGQILSTVIRRKRGLSSSGGDTVLYSSTHSHHPTVIWCSASIENFRYTLQLFKALSDEYTHRYKKVHATYTRLYEYIRSNLTEYERFFAENTPPLYLGSEKHTEHYFYAPPQCVDKASLISKGRGTFFIDKQRMLRYATLVTILAYRNYYRTKKAYFAKWTNREVPAWFTTGDDSDILVEKEAIDQAERVLTRYRKVSKLARYGFNQLWQNHKTRRANEERIRREYERARQNGPVMFPFAAGTRTQLENDLLAEARNNDLLAEAATGINRFLITNSWEPTNTVLTGAYNPTYSITLAPVQPVDHINIDIRIQL